MALEQLFERQRLLRVVLLYTPSSSLSLFVQDALKTRYNISKESVISIRSKKELNNTREFFNVVPFLSDRWLFHVKQADKLIKKDFIKLARDNTSGVYLLEFENYRNYKSTKDLLSKQQGILDLYLAWLRKKDFMTLYSRLVLRKSKSSLPNSLLNFVIRGYSSEIESVFKLFEVLKEGREIKTRKQVIEICGLSANTIDNFMFGLLKEPNLSDRGLKKYISNRLKEAVELADKYTWTTFRNYLKKSVKSCINVKMILSSGEVYDNIRNYENAGYDIKSIVKYQRFLPQIKKISLARFLGLLENIEKRVWRSDVDFLAFFFNYLIYKYNANEEVKELLMVALDRSKRNESYDNAKPKLNQSDLSDLEKDRLKTRSIFKDKLNKIGGY